MVPAAFSSTCPARQATINDAGLVGRSNPVAQLTPPRPADITPTEPNRWSSWWPTSGPLPVANDRERDQPLIAVSIVFRGYGWVDLEANDFTMKLWTDEATCLRQAWDLYERAVWKPRWHVLSLPGPRGAVFNMARWDRRTPCIEKASPPIELQTTVDRVLWEARTYGGYTVPLSSLQPGDVAEIEKGLQS